MLIECPECNARVDGRVEGQVERLYGSEPESVSGGQLVTLVSCPACYGPVVGLQRLLEYSDSFDGERKTWSSAKRVWPNPESDFDEAIPSKIRVCVQEARICLRSGAYTGSVAMAGRALEAIVRHFHPSDEQITLGRGLLGLHEKKVIDDRLFAWGKELQEHRNLAAHASGTRFGRTDAEDLYNFAIAICDYVFVLQEQYNRFVARKEEKRRALPAP